MNCFKILLCKGLLLYCRCSLLISCFGIFRTFVLDLRYLLSVLYKYHFMIILNYFYCMHNQYLIDSLVYRSLA